MWFEQLTGFKEESPENVREKLIVDGDSFISTVNNRKITFGRLEIPTLDQLRQTNLSGELFKSKIQISEVIADVKDLHRSDENKDALIQVASQFNLLEMVSPYRTPEEGVGIYERDKTQGPACAVACGAGTIYRNYFAKTGNRIGQSSKHQIDCLELIGEELNNESQNLWMMENGYALATQKGLLTINKKLAQLTDEQREKLKGKLKVGIQWNTEVTIAFNKQKVSQIYCSALPVAYSNVEADLWESFARLILEATYEATFWVALKNFQQTNSNKLFLTLVGGGAFGNKPYWILESLQKVISKFRNTPLDVKIVSYRVPNPMLKNFID